MGSAASGRHRRTRTSPGFRPTRPCEASAAFAHRPAVRVPVTPDAAGPPAAHVVVVGRRTHVLTVRYRNRETGMYAGAPFVDEWKPLTPRLHDLRTLERQRPGRAPGRGRGSRGDGGEFGAVRRGDGLPAVVPRRPGPELAGPRHRPSCRSTARSPRWTSPTPGPTRAGPAPGCRPRTSGSSPPACPASRRLAPRGLEPDRERAQRRADAVPHAQGRLGAPQRGLGLVLRRRGPEPEFAAKYLIPGLGSRAVGECRVPAARGTWPCDGGLEHDRRPGRPARSSTPRRSSPGR